METTRADFSPATKRKIAESANYLCSFNSGNYRCLRLTSCASLDEDTREKKASSLLMGKACHIVAASKNGPRGDVDMNDDDRADAENGIWMCSIHSDWIDKDGGNGYSVEELHKMKESHESYIRDVLMKGNTEYMNYQNGETAIAINEFSYPEDMYEKVVREVYKDINLNDSEMAISVEAFREEMLPWADEPFEYRQLAGIIFERGDKHPDTLSLRGSFVTIPIETLTKFMNNDRRLIDGFLTEISRPTFDAGWFEPRDKYDPFETPDRINLYSNTLCDLKKMYPSFIFQKLFLYGEVDFPR